MKNRKKIAIIGSGISGLSAAYFLKDSCDIVIYEKDDRIGGHSRTISVKVNDEVSIPGGAGMTAREASAGMTFFLNLTPL